MTRKDYIVIAKALGIAGKNKEGASFEQTLNIMARSLNYGNFDRVRFEAAANFHRTMPVDEAARVLAS